MLLTGVIKSYAIVLLTLTLFTVGLSSLSSAAEISYSDTRCAEIDDKAVCQSIRRQIHLFGEIVAGDYEAIKLAIRSPSADNSTKQVIVEHLVVSSGGGDVIEAMRIGRLVRQLFIDVDAGVINPLTNRCEPVSGVTLPSCMCASACTFILAAGIVKSGSQIGIHRPTFIPKYFASMSAQEAKHRYEELAGQVNLYLEEMEVAQPLIERMWDTPSTETYYLKLDELRYILSSPGYISEWIKSKCGTLTVKQERELAYRFGRKIRDGKAPNFNDPIYQQMLSTSNCQKHVINEERLAARARLK